MAVANTITSVIIEEQIPDFIRDAHHNFVQFLKSIFMSWRDRERDENVKTILSVSDEVVDRVEILMKHLNKTQESIKNTVTSWNNIRDLWKSPNRASV